MEYDEEAYTTASYYLALRAIDDQRGQLLFSVFSTSFKPS